VEIRGGEALSMLQAMTPCHDGSLSTGHGETHRGTCSLDSNDVPDGGCPDLPARRIKEQIASALDVIVQISRLKGRSRKVTNITEVQGMRAKRSFSRTSSSSSRTGYVEGKVQAAASNGHPSDSSGE